MSILSEIADYTRQRMAAEEAALPTAQLAAQARELASAELKRDGAFTFPFASALAASGLSFICEAKKASPSKGLIAPEFPYVQIARDYEAAGAAAISCLTEPHWFLGSDEYLREIASAVKIPVLRKDFVVSERMIYQAKCLGASAVLLICAILSDEQLREYGALAESLGLSALVEAHDEEEIARALAAGAKIVGVNNRNLKDFSVDFGNSRRLRELVPPGVLYVAESGVKCADDVAQIAALGADAALIGEALMRAEDKAATLAEFRSAAGNAASRSARCAYGGSLTAASPAASPVRDDGVRHPEQRESEAHRASSKDPLQNALRSSAASCAPRVKFCGITGVDDACAVNALPQCPDYAGLVCWPKSKRCVSADEARAIRTTLSPEIRTVGVFVDADVSQVAALVEDGTIAVAQLHGSESEAYIARLREAAPNAEIWKAFVVRGEADVRAANASSADMVLVDGGLGEGQAFDWALLSGITRPFVLAGGLSCDNVAQAIERLHPAAVDVSSGIEAGERRDDGRTRKDPEKMRAFMHQVHR